jgi:hypothetical protein
MLFKKGGRGAPAASLEEVLGGIDVFGLLGGGFGSCASKDVLDHIGKTEASKSDLLLDGIPSLGHVGVRERGVRLDGGVNGSF